MNCVTYTIYPDDDSDPVYFTGSVQDFIEDFISRALKDPQASTDLALMGDRVEAVIQVLAHLFDTLAAGQQAELILKLLPKGATLEKNFR